MSASTISFDRDFTHIVNGKKVTSPHSLSIINPSTEEIITSVPIATSEQLEQTVKAASDVFPSWASLPVEKRQDALIRLGNLVEQHLASFVDLLVKEGGKSRDLATIEVSQCVAWFREAGGKQSLPDEVLIDSPERKVIVRYVPLGVCAAITPFNFPLSLLVWKLNPALVTGNTIIVKPSPHAPLAALKLVELAQQVLPPGVLSILSGENILGKWLCQHPDVKRISVTGSIASGKDIMRSAADNLTRLTLELGGNDPAIVLPDVDPQDLAPKLFWGTFHNSGQICVSIKRIYVHERVYDAVRDALVAYARTINVGDVSLPGVGVGPVQNRVQFEKVKEFLTDCRQNGYKFALGGEVDPSRKGYFVPITIVDNPPEHAKIVQEEPFGPIVPLLKWSDEEDVIRRANATKYGLAASVWGRDIKRTEAIARRIESGTVWINESQVFHWDYPFGGFKHSGIGVEQSKHGLVSWTNIQTITTHGTA
ncbi:aldehyde dehydrogenase family protein [Obba rivulosa]|uniref:Aldehyde dehydrogenase family protein n=1 Tax=Obba rivulosa TaxID=1052685 RepID=A0A8E2AW76_9APHY|nr:aldehyde dehydrogenase family protein [Obba rivulosa]